jgi:NitT/TauT family transport system permease protein
MSSEAAATPLDRAKAASTPAQPARSPAYERYLRALRRRTRSIQAWQLGMVVVFLILWEVAPRANWINPMLTSYPSAVARTFMAMLEDGSLAKHTWVTFSETVVGFAGGMVLGTVCAVLLWWSTFLYRVLDPFIVVLNAMPKIALVPIFYIWLGDVASIYAMAIAVSVFITILMLYTGFQAIDPDKIKLVRLFGASRWKVLTKIVLPGSVPTMGQCRPRLGRRGRRRVPGRQGRAWLPHRLRQPDFSDEPRDDGNRRTRGDIIAAVSRHPGAGGDDAASSRCCRRGQLNERCKARFGEPMPCRFTAARSPSRRPSRGHRDLRSAR